MLSKLHEQDSFFMMAVQSVRCTCEQHVHYTCWRGLFLSYSYKDNLWALTVNDGLQSSHAACPSRKPCFNKPYFCSVFSYPFKGFRKPVCHCSLPRQYFWLQLTQWFDLHHQTLFLQKRRAKCQALNHLASVLKFWTRKDHIAAALASQVAQYHIQELHFLLKLSQIFAACNAVLPLLTCRTLLLHSLYWTTPCLYFLRLGSESDCMSHMSSAACWAPVALMRDVDLCSAFFA